MAGVVGRDCAGFGSSDGIVANLVTLGLPRISTIISARGTDRSRQAPVRGWSLVTRLQVAKPLARTKHTVLALWADGMVPGASTRDGKCRLT